MLSERLNAIVKTKQCPVSRLMDTLPQNDAEALETALNGRLSIREIHTALQQEGFRIARESLSHHRNGYCLCRSTK